MPGIGAALGCVCAVTPPYRASRSMPGAALAGAASNGCERPSKAANGSARNHRLSHDEYDTHLHRRTLVNRSERP